MSDREKVLNGLKHCQDWTTCDRGCPYYYIMEDNDLGFSNCTSQLSHDALELLKEQEPQPVIFDRKCEAAPVD